MNAILSLIATIDTEEAQTVREEITAELEKGKAKAEANRSAYADMWNTVQETLRLASAPVTAQEIADATGLSRGKIVWGLANLWADKVVKDASGKTNLYSLS